MSRTLRDFRSVLRPVGTVVTGLGGFLALCAAAGGIMHAVEPVTDVRGGGSIALAVASAVTLACGVPLMVWGRHHTKETITRREAILGVALIWIAATLFGAIPFVLGAQMTPVDAFFEATSGFTTTGATVIEGIDGRLSRPLLLWRSLIQWLGGMGIVVLFVAVFPNVGAGGKHMFRGEVSGTSAEGLVPRITETAFGLWRVYAVLTILAVVVLFLLGMSAFDAVCHAFTAISTSGFSTRDASIAAFDDAGIDVALGVFMILGSVNFGLHFAALRHGSMRPYLRSLELRVFLVTLLVATVLVSWLIMPVHGHDPAQALRHGFFQVVTFASTTGYTTDDYMAYPGPALGILLLLMVAGGSAGSTSSGIKVERVVLMVKQAWSELQQSFRPAVVRVVRMGRRVVEAPVLADVAAFFSLYMALLAVLWITVASLEGVPLPQAFGVSLTCLSNTGPAPFHDGADTFAAYAPITKVITAFAMLLGRLEFFTLLALLVPEFWKR